MFTWVLGNPCKRDLELELFSALKIFFHPPTTVHDNNHWSRGPKSNQIKTTNYLGRGRETMGSAGDVMLQILTINFTSELSARYTYTDTFRRTGQFGKFRFRNVYKQEPKTENSNTSWRRSKKTIRMEMLLVFCFTSLALSLPVNEKPLNIDVCICSNFQVWFIYFVFWFAM